MIGFDLETTSPHRAHTFVVHEAEIVGYSVAPRPGTAYYVPEKPEAIRDFLESRAVAKVCHNSKFEYGRLAQIGITLRNFEDTKIAAYLLGYPITHLKALTRQILSLNPITYNQVTGGRDMSDLRPDEIVEYASMDADHTLQLWPRLWVELKREHLDALYRNVEMPLVPVLYGMEAAGVGVEHTAIHTLLAELQAERTKGIHILKECTGVDNPMSQEQLARTLEKMGAPLVERTAVKEHLRVDEDSLLQIRDWHPGLIDQILGVRHLSKFIGYLEGWLDLRGADGRIHPQFNQAGRYEEASDSDHAAPETGRLSSSGPNFQNIPHHTRPDLAKKMRDCVVSRPGWTLLSADIGQEEPRITALVAPDAHMQALFDAGLQTYSPIGEALYGRPISKVDEHEWNKSKIYFLAKVYGCAAEKIREIDGSISLERARAAHNQVGADFPGLDELNRRVEAAVRDRGEMRDYFGRLRRFPKIWSLNPRDQAAAIREAINFQIQGPAATVLKLATVKVDNEFRQAGLAARLILSIHDELVAEVPDCELNEAAQILSSMTSGLMPINLPVELRSGKRWGSMNPLTIP